MNDFLTKYLFQLKKKFPNPELELRILLNKVITYSKCTKSNRDLSLRLDLSQNKIGDEGCKNLTRVR